MSATYRPRARGCSSIRRAELTLPPYRPILAASRRLSFRIGSALRALRAGGAHDEDLVLTARYVRVQYEKHPEHGYFRHAWSVFGPDHYGTPLWCRAP
jgi:hypothetical protein